MTTDHEARAREIATKFADLVHESLMGERVIEDEETGWLVSAIAKALEDERERGQNDVWLWLEGETVGVQKDIVLSQMGRFKRAASIRSRTQINVIT